MTAQLHRRDFLRDSLKLAGGALVAAPSLAGLAACNGLDPASPDGGAGLERARRGAAGYGPLQPATGGLPFLTPAGFTLKQLSRSGAEMPGGGGTVPNALDGMGAFAMGNGQVRLVRNHEIRNGAGSAPAIGQNPYDARAGAGCTTLVLDLDPQTGEPTLVREFVSISGTFVNCAGGPTPWGSWLTCEETVAGPNQGFARKHGYVFEVPAGADAEVAPVPLPQMGRFSHEAVAVDPRDGVVYLTEDGASGLSGFYRYLPTTPGTLSAGGTLEMLQVNGRPAFNATGRAFGSGDSASPAVAVPPLVPLAASWVTVDAPDPDLEGGAPSVFAQGLARGGARFRRLEGCWWSEADLCVYFNDTNGGAVGAGRVWQYRPQGPAAGDLTLVFESPSAAVLDAPDNICVSPRGGLVICEDGGGTQFIRGLTRTGQIFDFVRAADPNEATEFAGACYSPDGRVLFFNTQGSTDAAGTERGGTFAIWGPWAGGPL
jgi:secreted PhoX family phosphatase